MTRPDSGQPATSPAGARPIDFAELRGPVVRQVGQLMAGAAMTAPKSGGQLLTAGSPAFLETVLVEDPTTLLRLAEWMRARGAERREAIWFRDADAAQALDGVLFIGLVNPYPPNYDCGACGYATCAEFLHATKQQRADSAELEFTGPTCTLRNVDLGVAVGSAARTAALHCVDARCQTRIAVATRLAGTERRRPRRRPVPDPQSDHFRPPDARHRLRRTHPGIHRDPPVGVPGAIRADGARNKQQPRQPTPRRIPEAPPGVEPVTRNRVQRRRHGDRADHHRDPPTNRPASPARWDATQHRHPCHTPVGATMSIGSMLYGAGLSGRLSRRPGRWFGPGSAYPGAKEGG